MLKECSKPIHEAFPIGMVCKIERQFMATPPNSIAVVYGNYKLGRHHGISLITANGCYDDFSQDDIESIGVIPLRVDPLCQTYRFTSAIKLQEDFSNGVFDSALSLF